MYAISSPCEPDGSGELISVEYQNACNSQHIFSIHSQSEKVEITYSGNYLTKIVRNFTHSSPRENFPFEICTYKITESKTLLGIICKKFHTFRTDTSTKSEEQFLEIICKKFHTFFSALNDQVNMFFLLSTHIVRYSRHDRNIVDWDVKPQPKQTKVHVSEKSNRTW